MIERPKGRQPLPENATKVFSGIIFDVYQWKQELFDGTARTFEKLKRNDSGFVIPVLENGNILIVEDAQPGREAVITFPGGQLDPGEEPEEGVRRELREETGLGGGDLTLWKATNGFSKIDWVIYAFIGRGLTKVAEPDDSPGERITPHEISFDEFIALADDPRFQNLEILPELIRAQYDLEKKEELRRRIYG
ncbi:MAG TPA: NUDIX hydrolase [Candidatus Paceibacterota bacterium]|nr:NUDIX hydrolase [Candidatus Paceibacterota bacterium]